MENKNIIIILIAIIIVLACILGVMFFQPTKAKEASKIKITSDNSQYVGGKVSVKLTDLNKTAISKQKVNIVIKNKKGKVVVNKTVKTNSKGEAKLKLDLKKGEYKVNATYGGNENYTGNSTKQKLTLKEEVVKATVEESSNSYSSSQKSEREEYKITPDGWNPGEHEVSREPLDDGHERVNYDDGYFRIVDSEGNIITHGY